MHKSIIISLFMVIIAGFFFKLGFSTKEDLSVLYNYEVYKSDDYKVSLKPNDFYTSKVLSSGGYYASQSIDNFMINLKYDFKLDKSANLDYTYNVTADLVSKVNMNDNQDKEVWHRTFNLIDNKNTKDDMDSFSINQDVDIDYQYYNNLSHSYENKYGIVIDTTLKIYLNVYININLDNKNIDNPKLQDYIELDIPINSTVTQVNKNYQDITYNSITNTAKNVYISEVIYYIIGILFIIGAVIIIIIKVKNVIANANTYENNIKHILKYYSDLIVTVVNVPTLENLEVMNVTIFDDLIDIAEQNKKNIIYYEDIKEKKSNFYVIVDKYVYIYVITQNKKSY